MRPKKSTDRIGATPGKLALIGMLAVILAFVIIRQLPGRKSNTASVPRRQPESIERPIEKTSVNSVVKDNSQTAVPQWPAADLTKALQHDPFAPPSWIAQEKRIEKKNTESIELAELKQQGTAIVVITKDLKSATIGTQQYRIGDLLEGYTITDITTDGILLNKLSPQ